MRFFMFASAIEILFRARQLCSIKARRINHTVPVFWDLEEDLTIHGPLPSHSVHHAAVEWELHVVPPASMSPLVNIEQTREAPALLSVRQCCSCVLFTMPVFHLDIFSVAPQNNRHIPDKLNTKTHRPAAPLDLGSNEPSVARTHS